MRGEGPRETYAAGKERRHIYAESLRGDRRGQVQAHVLRDLRKGGGPEGKLRLRERPGGVRPPYENDRRARRKGRSRHRDGIHRALPPAPMEVSRFQRVRGGSQKPQGHRQVQGRDGDLGG